MNYRDALAFIKRASGASSDWTTDNVTLDQDLPRVKYADWRAGVNRYLPSNDTVSHGISGGFSRIDPTGFADATVGNIARNMYNVVHDTVYSAPEIKDHALDYGKEAVKASSSYLKDAIPAANKTINKPADWLYLAAQNFIRSYDPTGDKRNGTLLGWAANQYKMGDSLRQAIVNEAVPAAFEYVDNKIQGSKPLQQNTLSPEAVAAAHQAGGFIGMVPETLLYGTLFGGAGSAKQFINPKYYASDAVLNLLQDPNDYRSSVGIQRPAQPLPQVQQQTAVAQQQPVQQPKQKQPQIPGNLKNRTHKKTAPGLPT